MSMVYKRSMKTPVARQHSQQEGDFARAHARARDAAFEFSGALPRYTNEIYVWADRNNLQLERGYEFVDSQKLDQKNSIRLVCKMVAQEEHTDEFTKEVTDVVWCPGLIAVSKELKPYVEALNAAKEELKQAYKRIGDKPDKEDPTRKARRAVVTNIDVARFSHLFANRMLKWFDDAPSYVGFFWSRNRLIERITVREARHRLERKLARMKKGPIQVNRDANRDAYLLSCLPDSMPLALVGPGTLAPRANVWFEHETEMSGKVVTVTDKFVRYASLPLLFVGNALPKRLRELPEKPGDSAIDEHQRRRPGSEAAVLNRHESTRRQLEPTPLLKVLPVFRYLNAGEVEVLREGKALREQYLASRRRPAGERKPKSVEQHSTSSKIRK